MEVAGLPEADKEVRLKEIRGKAKLAYHQFDIGRPPFSYANRELYEPECMYDEAREDEVFKMEKEVFDEVPKIPQPTDPKLLKAYNALKSAERGFDHSIVTVQAQIQRKVKKATDNKIAIKTAHTFANESSREKLMENKNRYLQALKTYCDVAKRVHSQNGNTAEAQKMESLFQKTDTIYVAHTAYAVIRSLIHHEVDDPDVFREDESLTVQHLYTTSIHTMNRYLKKIKESNDPKKKGIWWTKMKEDLCTMLLHDWKEDLGHVRPQDMFATLFRLTSPKTQLQSLYRDKKLPQENSEDQYFFMTHFQTINSEVEKLSKLELTPDQKKLPKEEQEALKLAHEEKMLNTPRALANKCRDRINNLATLRYMRGNQKRKEGPADTQIRKIKDSHSLFKIGGNLWIDEAHDSEEKMMMLEELQLLCVIALREIRRLREKDGHELSHGLTVTLTADQRKKLDDEETYYTKTDLSLKSDLSAA